MADYLLPPHEAMARLLGRLEPVATERVSLERALGRVLAEPVLSDRPSPACDVSAMDGYAVRLADLSAGSLAVAGEVRIGQPPPPLPAGRALRIFTGSPVPTTADAVIRREDVQEHLDRIGLPAGLMVKPGSHIRYAGENLPQNQMAVPPGQSITPATVAALASFGVVSLRVYQQVRVSVLVTGDEVLAPEALPQPWQLRDSNGPYLRAMLGQLAWVRLVAVDRVQDDPGVLQQRLVEALQLSDAVLLTGGVSMGDYDHVPAAVRQAGCEVVFHKLAIRPGKPMLAGVGQAGPLAGKLVLGLPGNAVSVMSTVRRLGLVALRQLGGFVQADPPVGCVKLIEPDDTRLALWRYVPVCLAGPGQARRAVSKGSGDVVAAARSDGLVEIPPNQAGAGPWPFYAWQMG